MIRALLCTSLVLVLVLVLGLPGCKRDPVPDPVGDGTGTGMSPTADESSTTASVADDTGGTTGEPGQSCPARRHTLLFGDQCGQISIGDLDADGADDLLVHANAFAIIDSPTDQRIYSYLGTEPLLSAPEVHCCVRAGFTRFSTLLDINGDGRQDALFTATQETTSGDIGQSWLDLEQLVRGPMGGYVGRQQLVRVDLFVATPRAAVGALLPEGPAMVLSNAQELGIYQADGLTLGPAPAEPLMLEEIVEDLVTIDLDGDGLDDVVALLESRVVLVRSLGDGSLTLLSDSTPPVLGSVLLRGQLDGAGSDELLVVGRDGLSVGTLEEGAVQWTSQSLEFDDPATLADVNADGNLDLLTTSGSELVAFLGAGDGSFAEVPTGLAGGVGEGVADVGAGDFDGNGTTELVVCDAEGLLVVETP